MNSDDYWKLEEQRRYLMEWLERHKTAKDIAPLVQQSLEMVEWQIAALSNQPDEAAEIPSSDISSRIDSERAHLMNALPLMPKYSKVSVLSTTAYSTSGSDAVYSYVARVGDLGTPAAKAYSEKFTGLYRNLQKAQNRPQAVRQLVEKLRQPQTLARFDRAYASYLEVKTGGSRSGAAGDIRTLLHGIKGDLFEKARKQPKENMTWNVMVDRLVMGERADSDRKELILQYAKHGSLISRLSDVLKDREAGSLTDLDNVWAQVLDHIFTVLSLLSHCQEITCSFLAHRGSRLDSVVPFR